MLFAPIDVFLPKQLRVCPRSGKNNKILLFVERINQKEITSYMTLSVFLPFARQLMIFPFRRKGSII